MRNDSVLSVSAVPWRFSAGLKIKHITYAFSSETAQDQEADGNLALTPMNQ